MRADARDEMVVVGGGGATATTRQEGPSSKKKKTKMYSEKKWEVRKKEKTKEKTRVAYRNILKTFSLSLSLSPFFR